MSTHAKIIYRDIQDKKINQYEVFIHFDGYPAYLGRIIRDNKQILINWIIENPNKDINHIDIHEISNQDFDNPNTILKIKEIHSQQKGEQGEEFIYEFSNQYNQIFCDKLLPITPYDHEHDYLTLNKE